MRGLLSTYEDVVEMVEIFRAGHIEVAMHVNFAPEVEADVECDTAIRHRSVRPLLRHLLIAADAAPSILFVSCVYRLLLQQLPFADVDRILQELGSK